MRISSFATQAVRVPVDEPLANGPTITGISNDFVILDLKTDDGIEGIGVTRFGGALTGALKPAVDALAALTVGEDPLRIEAILSKLKIAGGGSGPGGIYTLALAAIDIALWDIKGKAFNQPVSKLAGGFRDRVPTYASGALMRAFPLDHLVKAGPRLVERGFKQMKTQLALPGITSQVREVERIKLVRESIGDEIDLMCDINERWDVRQAISIGRQIERYHLYWLEDIVAHDDYAGAARVAAALDTPLAAGEYVYGAVPFRHMLEARSVDIVMIDLVRAGGITPWLKIAGMAEAFNMPVVSHLFPEIHVHLVAAIPNGLTVEYMPWSEKLFESVPPIKDGQLVVPTEPGLGLKFDRAALKRFAL